MRSATAICRDCGETIEASYAGLDPWWSHEVYPGDHDAIPITKSIEIVDLTEEES